MKEIDKKLVECKSKRLILRILTPVDVSLKYVEWLNDPEINQYLETRFHTQNIDSCIEFVQNMHSNKSDFLFGIFLRDSDFHIGNIKLGFVNPNHKSAQISLFIGEKEQWNKGFATEAIKAITLWGFQELGLEKIEAGCYEQNLGSLRAFLKVGYQVEGFFRKHILLADKRYGSFWLGILPEELKQE